MITAVSPTCSIQLRLKRTFAVVWTRQRLAPLLYLTEGEELLFYLLPLRVGALPTKSELHHLEAGLEGASEGGQHALERVSPRAAKLD